VLAGLLSSPGDQCRSYATHISEIGSTLCAPPRSGDSSMSSVSMHVLRDGGDAASMASRPSLSIGQPGPPFAFDEVKAWTNAIEGIFRPSTNAVSDSVARRSQRVRARQGTGPQVGRTSRRAHGLPPRSRKWVYAQLAPILPTADTSRLAEEMNHEELVGADSNLTATRTDAAGPRQTSRIPARRAPSSPDQLVALLPGYLEHSESLP
jgi:hypothetical protein